MDVTQTDQASDGSIRHLLEGPIEQRLRASLAAVGQAEADIVGGQIVDLGPLARAIAVLAGDIQAMPAEDGARLAPSVSLLSDGLGALAGGLADRVRSTGAHI